jgi:hypothetical protein
MRTIPQNVWDATTHVASKLLPLHHVRALVRINTDHTGNEPIIILRTPCKVRRQKPNIARYHAIRNKKNRNCVFFFLVLIDHLLPAKHHFHSHLDLHFTGLMAAATSAYVACACPNNVNKH